MRIGINFHAFDDAISGVEYYSLGLIRGLAVCEGGHEVVVFTNRPAMVREYVGGGARVEIVEKAGLTTRVKRIAWEHLLLGREAAEMGVDVLHCPQYVGPVFGGRLPIVVTVHDLFALEGAGWGTWRNVLYYRAVMRRSLKTAARVVCVSESTAANVGRVFGVAADKLVVVYPGVESRFRLRFCEGDCAGVRQRYGLPTRYVLYVGNVEPKKNVGRLVEAMRILRERGWGHELVMAGERTWRSGRVMREMGRLEWVRRIGHVRRDDLPLVYAMADVTAVVSLDEGFGFVAAEAMACGCAVVTSGRGALSEVCGDAGVGVDCWDAEDIADGIERVLTDGGERDESVRRGVEASRRFTWEGAAKRMLEIYEEVCHEAERDEGGRR